MKSCLTIICCCILCFGFGQGATLWKAPIEEDEKVNPYNSDEDIIAGGVAYTIYCSICHGEIGQGDGPAGGPLPIPPKDLTLKEVREQSDGAIYWKISTGKGNMVSYESVFSEKERWQLVSYIRTLSESER